MAPGGMAPDQSASPSKGLQVNCRRRNPCLPVCAHSFTQQALPVPFPMCGTSSPCWGCCSKGHR